MTCQIEMLNNLDALEKVSFLGFACVFWAKNHQDNPVATRQRDHEKSLNYKHFNSNTL